MFNLIVAVISIALIAAMAAASIFYGGSAFGEGTAKAQASTLINNGQQISGGQQLYMIDNSGNRANAIAILTGGGYLQAVPSAPATVVDTNAAWEVATNGTFAYIRLDTDNTGQQLSPAETVCSEIVAQGGAANLTLGADLTQASALPNIGDDQFACVIDTGDAISGTGLIATRTAHFIYKL